MSEEKKPSNDNLDQNTADVDVVTDEFDTEDESIIGEKEEGLLPENELQTRIDMLEAALAKSEEKIAEQKDSVIRAKAEVENIRRRTEQEIDKVRKFSLDRILRDIIPTIDNLERAIDVADKDNEDLKPMLEGVELTLNSFLSILGKSGLTPVAPQIGDPFNPDVHQAMSIQEDAELAPNSVMLVMQKGYQLNGRVVRPAMVMVSKAPAEKE